MDRVAEHKAELLDRDFSRDAVERGESVLGAPGHPHLGRLESLPIEPGGGGAASALAEPPPWPVHRLRDSCPTAGVPQSRPMNGTGERRSDV